MSIQSKTVLITPQHWGLGHVTRTIPVIRYFLDLGWKVLLGSSDAGADLLRKEFPNLKVYELPDYKILYPSKNMYWNMAIQMYKMHLAIFKEYFAIKKICKENKVDLLISDARLGAAQSNVPSIVITHHLHFPLSYKLFEWFADTWMRFFYMRFNQIWIPDFEGKINIGGDLDHGFKSNKHYYVGALTRFQKIEVSQEYEFCFMISGPEPQRTYLEEKIIAQLEEIEYKKSILIRGTKTGKSLPVLPNLQVIDLATSEQLNHIMCASGLIICRSGYSTLLDLTIIRKKALLIPTPGQPEQEYLARELNSNKLFFSTDQDHLNLRIQLPIALEFPGYDNLPPAINLHDIVPTLLNKLNN
ncbi:MAG: glycosyltransferase [Saprospiraceae bacterium]|nr:glycosyltransferase [Saprospiraceae bacterium]